MGRWAWAVGLLVGLSGVQALAVSEFDRALSEMRLITVNVISRTSDDGTVVPVESALSEEDCLDISRQQKDLLGAKLIEMDMVMDDEQRDFYSRSLNMLFISRRVQYCFGEVNRSN